MNYNTILKCLITNTQKNIVNALRLQENIPSKIQEYFGENVLGTHEFEVAQALQNIQSNINTGDYQLNALREVILFIEKDGYDVSDFSLTYNFDEEEGLFIFISLDMEKSFAILYQGGHQIRLFYVDEAYDILDCANIEDAVQKDQKRTVVLRND